MKLLKYIILLAIGLVNIQLAFSQDKKSMQLRDKITNQPIAGATFVYDKQNGFSDELGKIEIEYNTNSVLIINHISYGQWTFSGNDVSKALNEGVLVIESNIINLQPVSIIAYHPANQSKTINLNVQDQLNHDAGAVLNSDISINSIKKSGSYGFDPVLRGFKYDQLNIVINGSCSASAACPNRMDPVTSQIPLNAIESIQILKGPYSLRYGTSFGGTINFLTPKPAFSNKFKTTTRLSATYENNGNIYRSEGIIGLHSKNIDLKLVGSWSEGDDYLAGNKDTVQSDFLRSSFGADLSVKLTKKQYIKLSANRNFGRNTDFPTLPMDLINDDTWLLNAEHSFVQTDKKLASWKTILYATHVNHLMDNSLKMLNPRTMNAKSPTQTLTYGGRTETAWHLGSTTSYAGFDLKVENAEGKRTRELLTGPNAGKIFTDNIWQNSKIARGGFFAETNIVTPLFLYVVAARLEISSADATEAATEFTTINSTTNATNLNPSVSAGIIKNFNNKYAIKLWAGSSQRAAGLTEMYINYFAVGRDAYELLGNPLIKPERNNQTDIIFEIKSEKTYLNVNLFASYIQNYITSVKDTTLKPRIATSPGVRKFVNLDNAFKTGFEINWKQYLFYGLQHQVGIAYTYAQDMKTKLALPEIAPLELRYTLSGNYLNNKLISNISVRHAVKQSRVSLEYGEKETPEFTTLDFNISYNLFKYVSVTAGVQNIFDVAYYEHLNRSISGNSAEYILNRGRNFYFTLVFDLK